MSVVTAYADTVTRHARVLARDTGIVMARELRPVFADPFSLLFGRFETASGQ